MARPIIFVAVVLLAGAALLAPRWRRAPMPRPVAARDADAPHPDRDSEESRASIAKNGGIEPFPQAAAGPLGVRVASEADGAPVCGARVDVVPMVDRSGGRRRIGALTDERGEVRFEQVPAGPLQIFAGDRSRYWALDAGASDVVDVVLAPSSGPSVLVTDPGGDPIAGAAVWVSGPGSADRGEIAGSTGRDGRLALRSVSVCWIAARAEGLAWSDRMAAGEPREGGGNERALRIALMAPARTLRGRVLDDEGAPIAGAWVACRRVSVGAGGPPVVETSTGDAGLFEIEGLADGAWVVEGWNEGRAPALASVTVGPGSGSPLDLVLGRGASIEGCVRDAAGLPLGRVQVSARAESFIGRGARTVTSDAGTFRLEGLPDAIVSVRAGYLAGDAVRASLDLRAAPRVVWDPVLITGRVVAGRVTDEHGAGRSFAQVRASVSDSRMAWVAETVADRDGRFEIANAPEAALAVEVDVARWGPGATARIEGVRPGSGDIAVVIPEENRPSAFVFGSLVGHDGKPLAGLVVGAARVPNPPDHPPSARSRAEDGGFRIGPLAPGSYEIEALARGGSAEMLARCELGAEEEVDLGPLAIGSEGFLKVFVARGAGTPRSVDLVVLDRLRRRVANLRPVADFAASGPLANGPYALCVSGTGVEPVDIPFTIRGGDTTTLEVPIKAGK